MSQLLYIKANPKPANQSRTFAIADSFIARYKELNPDDKITTLDLYQEGIGFLTNDDLRATVEANDNREHPVLKYAHQFAAADSYIIAAPMWNLSFPAILRAYLDYICVVNITFKYTETGPVGMCIGKKALHIITRGGEYSKPPLSAFEMGDRYLKALFGFLGITDFKTIVAENLDVVGQDVEGILRQAITEAQELVPAFGKQPQYSLV